MQYPKTNQNQCQKRKTKANQNEPKPKRYPLLVGQSFRTANEREPAAMLQLQQQLKPETLKECQEHFAEAQKEQKAAEAAAAAAAAEAAAAVAGGVPAAST